MIWHFVRASIAFPPKGDRNFSTLRPLILQQSKSVDRFWSHVCRQQWLSCSPFRSFTILCKTRILAKIAHSARMVEIFVAARPEMLSQKQLYSTFHALLLLFTF